MSVVKVARTLNLIVSFCLIELCSAQYNIPDVTIKVFKPKGFTASIPDALNLSLFVFQGNVNRAIGNNDIGSLSGEVVKASNGRWTYYNPQVELNIGDVINFYVFVAINQAGYLRDNLSHTITKFDDIENRFGEGTTLAPQSLSKPAAECLPTLTTVRGINSKLPACSGQTVFEDNFDILKTDIWQVEQYIPISHTDYPFVSYQRQAVSTADGNLRIKASLLQNEPGFTNDSIIAEKLNLRSGCTSQTESCYVQASGPDILPPVVTGRIVTRQFAFTYGTVQVRAKLPQGDWLYPEILLEPLLKKYGEENDISGVLKIATAQGNKVLRDSFAEYGNKILYGGAVIDAHCPEALIANTSSTDGRNWGDDFHVFSVRWAPERIILLVDDVEWARIESVESGLRSQLPLACLAATTMGSVQPTYSGIAPFDDLFYLTLGVDAGGITEFKDGTFTVNNRRKPWTNYERKARLGFWNDLYAWYPTWTQPELLIDYIKVIAI